MNQTRVIFDDNDYKIYSNHLSIKTIKYFDNRFNWSLTGAEYLINGNVVKRFNIIRSA